MRVVDLVVLLPAFVVAVLLISASPGPAMALILRRAALDGWRGAVPTVLGLELGLYVWALVAAAGFAALVATSQVAFVVLRVVGAVVLLFLGVRAWVGLWRERDAPDAPDAPKPRAAEDTVPVRLGRRQWLARFSRAPSCSWPTPRQPSS
jgi:threonine/homoserine/homoserine lactone efflux protein